VKMKTGVTVIDHKEEFYKYLDKHFGGDLAKNIRIFEKQGKLALMPEKIDFDEDEGSWCGSIYLKINKKLTAEEIVNNIIGEAYRPDEVSLKDGVLRLWWD
jgi:hypothetical protein